MVEHIFKNNFFLLGSFIVLMQPVIAERALDLASTDIGSKSVSALWYVLGKLFHHSWH